MSYQDEAWKALQAREVQYTREIAKVYREAMVEMRVILQDLYDRWAVNGELSYAEMTRANRMTTMERQLLEVMDDAQVNTFATIDRLLPQDYEEAFFRQAWAIDNENGVRLGWGTINKDAVLEVFANQIYYDKAKWRYPETTARRTQQAIARGLTRGKSYADMARDIGTVANKTAGAAVRIAQTEGHYAQLAGTADTYTRAAEAGIDGDWVWISTRDGRTRETHQVMDHKVRAEDGLFDGPGGERCEFPGDINLSAGERINCRCDIRYEVTGYQPIIMRQRDAGVVPYQSYGEWFETTGARRVFR